MRDQYHRLCADMQQIAVARNPADGRIYAYMIGEPLCFRDCVGNGLVFMTQPHPTPGRLYFPGHRKYDCCSGRVSLLG